MTKNFSKASIRQRISPACSDVATSGRGRKKTILFIALCSLTLLMLARTGQTQMGENPLEGMQGTQYQGGGQWTSPGTGQAAPYSTPKSSQGKTMTGGGTFGNPLGVDTIEGVLANIMSYLRGIAGTIAVIFIIIGGIMYMVSGGSKETTERAKKTLICAIAGLAIVLAAPLFYQEIKAILGGGNPGSALQQVLGNVLKLLLSIVGFLAIISIVVGAIWMFTAVGDEEKYELGKKTATYSIIGLVIALASLIIAQQVTSLIGGGVAPNNPSLPASSLPSGWNRGGQD